MSLFLALAKSGSRPIILGMEWIERGHRQQSWPQVGLQLELVGDVVFDPGEAGQEHRHSFWELLLPVGQGFTLLSPGGDLRIPKDALALVPPELPHTVRSPRRGGAGLVYLGFSAKGFDVPDDRAQVLRKSPAVEALQEAVVLANRATSEGRRADWFAVLGQVQVLMAGLGMTRHPDADEGENQLVTGILAYLERHRTQPVSVRAIAESFYRSPGYIGELFVAQTGQTIKKYHRGLRLDEAARRLRCPGASVKQVAADLGFSSAQVLSREFTAWFGQPPSALLGR